VIAANVPVPCAAGYAKSEPPTMSMSMTMSMSRGRLRPGPRLTLLSSAPPTRYAAEAGAL